MTTRITRFVWPAAWLLMLSTAPRVAQALDWRHVPALYQEAGGASTTGFSLIKVTNTAAELLVYAEVGAPWSAHTHLFIDSDLRPDTGFHGGWMTHGYDVLVDGWGVFAYCGTGHDWSWTNIGPHAHADMARGREVRIPRAWLGAAHTLLVFGHTSNPDTALPADESSVQSYDWVAHRAPAPAPAPKPAPAPAPAPKRKPVRPATTPAPATDDPLPPAPARPRRHQTLMRDATAPDWRTLAGPVHEDGALFFSNNTVYVQHIFSTPVAFSVEWRLPRAARAMTARRAPLDVRATPDGRTYRAHWTLPPLTCDVFFSPAPDGVRIAMLTQAATACVVRAGWALDLPPPPLTWHDDARHARAMRPGETYEHSRTTGIGFTGRHARYPWAVVSDARDACAVLVDVSEPVFHSVQAGTRKLTCAFDAALSALTPQAPLCAAWEAVVCRVPAAQAWRATTARYYEQYPAFAQGRGPRRDGLWLPFTNPAGIRDATAFGFAAHEYLHADTAWNAAHELGSFFYSEPTLAWWPMPAGTPRTKAVLLKQFEAAAREGNTLARAVLADGQRDAARALQADFLTMPWNDGARIRMAPLPPAPQPSPRGAPFAAHLWGRCSNELARTHCSGLYLDSMNANTALSYSRSQLARSPFPAVTALNDSAPGLHGCVALFAWCEFLADVLAPRGLQLMGNYPFAACPFLARFIDVPGEETTWFEHGQYTPMPLAELDYLRAMSGQKSYLFLQCCDFDGFAPYVERYLARCGAYGFFPSMFSHNSADQPYWQCARWYERDRPLFARYVPVIAAMARAGWQPLPAAHCDAALVCEQFGAPGATQGWWISLYNPASHIVAGYVHLNVTGAWLALQPLNDGCMPADRAQRVPVALAPETWLPLLLMPAERPAPRAAAPPVVTHLVARAAALLSMRDVRVPPAFRASPACREAALEQHHVMTPAGRLLLGATAVFPPLTVRLHQVTTTTYRTQARLPMQVWLPDGGTATVTCSAAGLTQTCTVVAAAPLATQLVWMVTAPTSALPVCFAAMRDGWTWQMPASVRRLAEGASMLRASDVRVTVDSCFPGYTAAPLRDGRTETNLPWDLAAWASGEHAGAHWIAVQLPEPAVISTVRVYWAMERGTFCTARALEVWGAAPGESLRCLRRATAPAGQPVTELALPQTPLQRLRVVQPDGMGASARPHLMWVRELELLPGAQPRVAH